MTRVYVVCEGQTEETFCKEVIQQALPSHVSLQPVLLRGDVSRGRLLSLSLRLLKQTLFYVTTMVDLYGLGRGWPEDIRTSAPQLETLLNDEVCQEMGPKWNSACFRAHIQPHEFESLLFSDPRAMAKGMNQEACAASFQRIRDDFTTPEEINNSPQTSPSHRIQDLVPGYQKVLMGNLSALEVGLPAMERECPHFAQWLGWLRSLPDTP